MGNFTQITPRAAAAIQQAVRAINQQAQDARGRNNPFNSILAATSIIPCQVVKDGGVAGSMASSTSCNFTYTLYDLAGNHLKNADGSNVTGKTPDVARFSNCKYDQPADMSPGIAYRDSSGSVHLFMAAQEKPSGTTVTYITQIQVVDASQQIQVKTRQALVLDDANESGWTTIYTGSTCS